MLLRGVSVSAWDRGHTIHGGTITGVGERGGSHLQEVKEVKEREVVIAKLHLTLRKR